MAWNKTLKEKYKALGDGESGKLRILHSAEVHDYYDQLDKNEILK